MTLFHAQKINATVKQKTKYTFEPPKVFKRVSFTTEQNVFFYQKFVEMQNNTVCLSCAEV